MGILRRVSLCALRQGTDSLTTTRLLRGSRQLVHTACLASSYPITSGRRPAALSIPRPDGSRAYATASLASPPRDVAVVGGGITGLTAAYYLSKFLPSTSKITVLEAGRVGGWINTVTKEAPGGGKVYFENGPRMLRGLGGTGFRGDDYVFYDLMSEALEHTTLKDHIPRKKMFYYNNQLFTIPPPLTQLHQLLTGSHVLSGALAAGASYRRLRKQHHPPEILQTDVSIADFLRSTFGHNPAPSNMLSAMMHGIYGGSIERLSLPSVLPGFWYGTYKERTLGTRGEFVPRQDLELMRRLDPRRKGEGFAERVRGWCVSEVLAFEGGMQSLTEALLAELGRRGVHVRTGVPVEKIRYLEREGKVEVDLPSHDTRHTAPGSPHRFDKVIWTAPSASLSKATSHNQSSPLPLPTEAVSIRTISLWYPQPTLTAKHNGFGYLIPLSTPNPEDVLGVFFDSDTYGAQPDEQPGTKLTALMGGHFWAGKPPKEIPTEEECIRRAIEIARRHLGITHPPALVHANFAPGCIPQHVVGHRARLKATDEALRGGFGGRLAVAGGSFTAVGVMPGMRAGYDVAYHVGKAGLAHVGDTGLGQFGGPLEVVEVERGELNSLGKRIRDPDVVQRFFMGM